MTGEGKMRIAQCLIAVAVIAAPFIMGGDEDDVPLAIKDGKHLFAIVRFNGHVGYTLGPWPDAPSVEASCQDAALRLQRNVDQKIREGSLPPLAERRLQAGEVVSSCEWSVEAPPLARDEEIAKTSRQDD